METKTLFNCVWAIERYTDSNPDLFYHTRIRYTCIESDNPLYPVGSVWSAADTEV